MATLSRFRRADPASARSLAERCRAAGLKLTPQRLAIYRALVGATDHPSPEGVFERVRGSMPSLSLATVYKTLDAFSRLGLVAEVPATGNAKRYDGNMDRHHHLVCVQCNRVTDYCDPTLDRLAAPARLPGFTAHHVSVHIHGVCDRCSRSRGPHHQPD